MELSRQQVADLLNVTPRTVSQWQTDPDFPQPAKRGRSNVYDGAAVMAWWKDNEIAKLIEGEDGQRYDLSHERARLAHVQTERQRLLLARERRELVAIEDVTEAVGDDYTRVRARLLAVPPKCAPLCHRAESVAEIRETLDEAVREALAELSDPADGPGGDGPGGEPAPVDAEAA